MRHGRLALITALLLTQGCWAARRDAFQSIPIDHNRIVVLQDLSRVYDLYARSFDVSFKVANSDRDSVKKAYIETGVGTKITRMYAEMDSINADVRNFIIVAYSKYVTTISAANGNSALIQQASDGFDDALRTIADHAVEMRRIGNTIKASKAQETGIDEALLMVAELKGKTRMLSQPQ